MTELFASCSEASEFGNLMGEDPVPHLDYGAPQPTDPNHTQRPPHKESEAFQQFLARQQVFLQRKEERRQQLKASLSADREQQWRIDRGSSRPKPVGSGRRAVSNRSARSAGFPLSSSPLRAASVFDRLEFIPEKRRLSSRVALQHYTDVNSVRLRRCSQRRTPSAHGAASASGSQRNSSKRFSRRGEVHEVSIVMQDPRRRQQSPVQATRSSVSPSPPAVTFPLEGETCRDRRRKPSPSSLHKTLAEDRDKDVWEVVRELESLSRSFTREALTEERSPELHSPRRTTSETRDDCWTRAERGRTDPWKSFSRPHLQAVVNESSASVNLPEERVAAKGNVSPFATATQTPSLDPDEGRWPVQRDVCCGDVLRLLAEWWIGLLEHVAPSECPPLDGTASIESSAPRSLLRHTVPMRHALAALDGLLVLANSSFGWSSPERRVGDANSVLPTAYLSLDHRVLDGPLEAQQSAPCTRTLHLERVAGAGVKKSRKSIASVDFHTYSHLSVGQIRVTLMDFEQFVKLYYWLHSSYQELLQRLT